MFVGFSFAAGDGFRLRLHSEIKGRGVCALPVELNPLHTPGRPPHGCWHGNGTVSSLERRVTAQEWGSRPM